MAGPSPPPRRVWVVGCSGAGKSTFARALAERIGAPHVEIDAHFHGPGWTPTPRDELRTRIGALLGGDAWVVDGNYRSALGTLVSDAADTVAWLDPPRHVVMRSIAARTFGRMRRRTELWNGNHERWRDLFDPRPRVNIVLWAWTQFSAYRRGYAQAQAAAPPSQTWHRFVSRDAAWSWLASVPP